MITSNVSTGGANGVKKYFSQSLSRDDYYLKDNKIAGKWIGRGAERLSLSGNVKKDEFYSLCDNLNPETGEKLTARMKDNRRIGYDFTFGVPKSFSIVQALNNDKKLLNAFHEAVNETLIDIEKGAEVRVRKNGAFANRNTGEMTIAQFTHFTSRPVEGSIDMHLHAHNFIFNATFDTKEKQWKAIELGDVKKNLPYFQAVFKSRLAIKAQKLGYDLRKTKNGWEIADISDTAIKEFSKRTLQIEKIIEEKGIYSPAMKAEIGEK
jgi:conjugative relaxase-like TrwC/TraI family protein